jgi:hypothetical protein
MDPVMIWKSFSWIPSRRRKQKLLMGMLASQLEELLQWGEWTYVLEDRI